MVLEGHLESIEYEPLPHLQKYSLPKIPKQFIPFTPKIMRILLYSHCSVKWLLTTTHGDSEFFEGQTHSS